MNAYLPVLTEIIAFILLMCVLIVIYLCSVFFTDPVTDDNILKWGSLTCGILAIFIGQFIRLNP